MFQYKNKDTPNPLAEVVKAAFGKWAKKHPQHKDLFKKLNEPGKEIIATALTELPDYRPGVFDLWWTYEHMRFRKVKHTEQRLAHEIIFHFLTEYARGKIGSKAPASRKATA